MIHSSKSKWEMEIEQTFEQLKKVYHLRLRVIFVFFHLFFL